MGLNPAERRKLAPDYQIFHENGGISPVTSGHRSILSDIFVNAVPFSEVGPILNQDLRQCSHDAG
jgi:hypothetical protein